MNNQNPPSFPEPIFFNENTSSFSPMPEQQPPRQNHNHKPFPSELLKRLISNNSSNNLLATLLSQSLQPNNPCQSPDFAIQALSSLLSKPTRQEKKPQTPPPQAEKEEIIKDE